MFLAILISILIPSLIIFLAYKLIRPFKTPIEKVSKGGTGRDVGEVYMRLKRAGIETKYNYNRRETS